jgi:hypothetical protein
MCKDRTPKYVIVLYVKIEQKDYSTQYTSYHSEPKKIFDINFDSYDVAYLLEGESGYWTQDHIIYDVECDEINKRLQRQNKLERILGEQTEIYTYKKKS